MSDRWLEGTDVNPFVLRYEDSFFVFMTRGRP